MTYSPFPLGSGNDPAGLLANSPSGGGNSLRLNASVSDFPEISLSQTGTIPADAMGLWIGSAGYIQAFVDGTKVGEVNGEFGSQVTLDVSPYAGQPVNLEFRVRGGDTITFDIFGFVPAAVPEPSTYALFGVGFAVLGWQAWRRRS
jgi:hypothetical protein